ncbi:hypothetical protein Vadar_029082 [Vaccinium darrowii]|uniref:Uncharacterized protein n=1 Tax=Vaccinium darrowii TaxID=229202 RepID=A0ACB7ZFJ0_9ERIC|nr:hypothetical protein Vadar_029082 [Vaccinium darrowii]
MGDIVEKLEYGGMINYYYVLTRKSIKNGLKMILTDRDVLDMIKQLPPSRVVDLYIDHVSPLAMMTEGRSFEKCGPSEKGGPSDKGGSSDKGGPNEGVQEEIVTICRKTMMSCLRLLLMTRFEWGGIGNQNGKDKEVNDDENYGDVSSDELHSVHSDSDGDGKDKYPEFRAETDMGKVQFCVGMKFGNAKEFREAVREYAIKEGKQIKFTKNETTRVRAKCPAKGCTWEIFGSLAQRGESFQVKSFKSEHKCVRSFKVRHVTSMYLAKKYADSIRTNPNMPLEHLQNRVKKNLVVDVSRAIAYRAKRKALKLIEGTNLEQYALLRDYCEEIRRTNPNTTIIIKTIPPPTEDGQPTFDRIYICLGALKEGMLSGCRRFICMDACFLKSSHGGQLLVGMGIDANNQSFPFVYAVVESETKDSWMWFLELVIEDLQIVNNSTWTFMSNKQKGLVPALEAVVPNAEIRFCTRHLYANFRDLHRGVKLRKQLWITARATIVQEFHKAMQTMKEIDVEAFNWLAEKPPN